MLFRRFSEKIPRIGFRVANVNGFVAVFLYIVEYWFSESMVFVGFGSYYGSIHYISI